jgi:hypothetical protein
VRPRRIQCLAWLPLAPSRPLHPSDTPAKHINVTFVNREHGMYNLIFQGLTKSHVEALRTLWCILQPQRWRQNVLLVTLPYIHIVSPLKNWINTNFFNLSVKLKLVSADILFISWQVTLIWACYAKM